MSCSAARRSGSAPMKPRSIPVTLSAPLMVPRVWPCHVTPGARYFAARPGLCWLKTLSVYSRTISMFDRVVVSFTTNGSFSQWICAHAITNRRKDTAGDGDRGRSRPSAVTGVDLRVPNDELGRVLHAGTGADIGAVLRASNDTGHSSSSTFG